MKRFVNFTVVLFWLIMVGLLVRRNLPQPPPPPASSLHTYSIPASEAREEWMGIYQQEQKVGYLQRQITPSETGYHWNEIWRMWLRVLDIPQALHTEVQAETDRSYALTRFNFRLLSSGAVFRVNGEVKEQILHGQITTGGETSPVSFPLRESLYLPATTELALHGTAFQPGEERQFSVFNPLSMRTETLTVTAIGPEALTLKGEKVAVTKIAERFA